MFECFLSPGEQVALLDEITDRLKPEEDVFLLLRLDPRAKVITLGTAHAPDDPPFFYQG